jgi:hypothetical protein
MTETPLTRALFAKPIRFVAGVATMEQFPELTLPEVAFIGRSNVGKSSLLNALVNHGSLARTSGTPGATRLELVVDDDGPGIAPAQLHDPPSPPGQPARRRLGLSIVRQVMDLHGGQLMLGNELPRGFVAQLVFPLQADDWGMDDELAEALVGADEALAQAGTSGARNT